MPSNLTRTDQVLLHYLCEKTNKTRRDGVSENEIQEDIKRIQERCGEQFFSFKRGRQGPTSEELKEDLRMLESTSEIITTGRSANEKRYMPAGFGYIFGQIPKYPDRLEQEINNVIDSEETSSNLSSHND